MDRQCKENDNRWLHRFAVLTAIATFLLLGAGGLVTSHEAGMSVPDWPNSYGYNMFAFPVSKWTGGIFYEHTHRLWASVVGLLTYILVLWIFGKKSRPFMRWSGIVLLLIGIVSELAHSKSDFFKDSWLIGILYGAAGIISFIASFFWPRCERSTKWLCWVAVAAIIGVIVQGILGGLRVILIKADLGVVHGVVGQTFFVLMCAIALFTGGVWQKISGQKLNVPRGLRNLVLAATLLIFFQLMLGATMRGQHAGLAIPDFPAAYGQLWPDTSPAAVVRYNAESSNPNIITAFQILLQMVHRLGALAIFICVTTCAVMAWRQLGGRDPLAKFALFWLALIVFQIGLGIATIETNKAADIATAHVLVGALSLVTGALWCIIAFGRSEKITEVETGPSTVFGTLAANKR